MEHRTSRKLAAAAACVLALRATNALAAGGGQNMLLVVNPDDENSLRIVNEYARLRAIPASNIVYLPVSATDRNSQTGAINVDVTSAADNVGRDRAYVDRYLTPIYNAIRDRGLNGQIDYIAPIGLPNRFQSNASELPNSNPFSMSLESGLTYMDTVKEKTWYNGKPFSVYSASTAFANPAGTWGGGTNSMVDPRIINTNTQSLIALNTNTAIHHANSVNTSYFYRGPNAERVNSPTTVTPYMAGRLAFTGFGGNTVNEVIRSLQNAAATDGTKPDGTVYLVNSHRDYQFPDTISDLTLRGVKVVRSDSAPVGKTDALGLVQTYGPHRSNTFLPGGFGSSLESFGAKINDRSQNKATDYIASGASASAGTVEEPGATGTKFIQSQFYSFMADGSTHGESYAKTLQWQQESEFIGDMLAKPFADIPTINLSSAPANGTVVSGNVNVAATAGLAANKKLATGIAKVQLWVDGKLQTTQTGGTGNFSLDTATLSDGRHELRVVAINNAAAESEGYVLRDIVVNNKGRSISAATDLVLKAKQTASVPLSITKDAAGTVARTELRQLGRVLATGNGAPASLSIDATKLAYGSNPVIPVAVFSDGTEVSGAPINVTRQPNVVPGKTPAAPADRVTGFKGEFWAGGGGLGKTSAFTFIGAPTATSQYSKFSISNRYGILQERLPNSPELTPFSILDPRGVSARFTATFSLDANSAGEYQFFPGAMNDAYRIFLDGEKLWDVSETLRNTVYFSDSVFMGTGEHTLILESGQWPQSSIFNTELLYRGPDGITRTLGDTGGLALYSAVPEPTSLSLLGLATLGLAARRRRA